MMPEATDFSLKDFFKARLIQAFAPSRRRRMTLSDYFAAAACCVGIFAAFSFLLFLFVYFNMPEYTRTVFGFICASAGFTLGSLISASLAFIFVFARARWLAREVRQLSYLKDPLRWRLWPYSDLLMAFWIWDIRRMVHECPSVALTDEDDLDFADFISSSE